MEVSFVRFEASFVSFEIPVIISGVVVVSPDEARNLTVMLSNCHNVFVAVGMLSGNCVLFNTMDGSCMVVMFCDVIVAEISVSVRFLCEVVVVIFDRLFVVDISFWVVVAVCVVAVVVIGEVAVGVVVICVVIVFVDGAVVGVVVVCVAVVGV